MNTDTATEIQKKALELFKEHGYTNVTLDDICAHSGVSKTTFYYHFKTKDQLFARFFDCFSKIPAEAMQKIALSDNSWEKLWNCFVTFFDWSIENGPEILGHIIITDMHNEIDTFAIMHEKTFFEIFTNIIKKGIHNGDFKCSIDAEIAAGIIRDMITVQSIQWCMTSGAFDLKVIAQRNIIALLGVREDLQIVSD